MTEIMILVCLSSRLVNEFMDDGDWVTLGK